MRVRALRGVCIGPGRHLTPGETADLEPALVQFLVNITAVEAVKDEPQKPQPTATEESKSEPAKEPKQETQSQPQTFQAPAKSGKKEK